MVSSSPGILSWYGKPDRPQQPRTAQMDRSDPRRFLLVCREAPVTDSDGGSWRWSIDHLFVDQDAIPTLVEVKRSSDTRIRREVVGQMLDYAANGTRYWGEGTLHQLFERTCAGNGLDPAIALADVAGADTGAQDFWERADRNLRGGMLRLVFVADVIPDELASVIEFLNTRMHDTEVYGIEVRRYGGTAAEECFVPRLVGATAAAQAEKRAQTSLDEKLQNSGPEILTAAERLQFLGEELGLRVRQFPASLRLADQLGTMVLLYPTYRTLEFPLDLLHKSGQETEAGQIWEKLQHIAGDTRKVTMSSPNIGVREALADWDAVADIVRTLARLRAEASP
jgi:hypothetical protein